MSANSWPWNELGLSGISDKKSIMSAYAAKLKSINRDDPEAFARLQNARKAALAISGVDANKAAPRPTMIEAARGEVSSQPRISKITDSGENSQTSKRKEEEISVKSSAAELTNEVEILSTQEQPELSSLKNPRDRKERAAHLTSVEFWREYEKALFERNFRLAAELLRSPFAEDRGVRLQAEQMAFRVASQMKVFETQDLELFEDEFHWATDRFSILKRLGNVHAPAEFWKQLSLEYCFRNRQTLRSDPIYQGTSTSFSNTNEINPFELRWKEVGLGSSILYIFNFLMGLLVFWQTGRSVWFLQFLKTKSLPDFFVSQVLLFILSGIILALISFPFASFFRKGSDTAPNFVGSCKSRALQMQQRLGDRVNWALLIGYTILGCLVCALMFFFPSMVVVILLVYLCLLVISNYITT